MHLGLYCTGPLCTALLVSSVTSRGAPCWSGVGTSVSEGGKLGREMADRFCLGTQLPCNHKGSLTHCKSATRGKQLYFPSKGSHAEDFYTRKNPTALAGFEPANSGTTRPPKPPVSTLVHSYMFQCFKATSSGNLMWACWIVAKIEQVHTELPEDGPLKPWNM
jgi:hypothetical protein